MRLDRRVGPWWCAAAWVLATVVFVGWVGVFGGPSGGDAQQSTVAVLAMARGDFHCAYPSDVATPTPPLYPVVAAAVVAVARLEGPTHGSHCQEVVTARGLLRVRWVGVLGWLALLAGFVALLRAVGRGRSLWECVGVVVLACLAPAVSCIATFFHPNDLMAMGLVLGAVACCLRVRWGWAGVLVGLACMTHQFALLVAVPLAVLALLERRLRFFPAALAAVAAVAVPATALIGWGVVRAIVGEGVAPTTAVTWVDHLGLSNDGVAVLSRMVPLVLAGGLALVARRRLGAALSAPTRFCSLVATCLGLRLLFEINLLGYRFMAYVVMLVVVDWVGGRIRWVTVAWLAGITLLWPVDNSHESVLVVNQGLLVQVVTVLTYFALVAPPLLRRPGTRAEIW